MDVVAQVTQPRYTGWQRDYCTGLVSVELSTACMRVGGDIYRAVLRDVRTPAGTRVASRLVVAFPAHALASDYRARVSLHLVEAPEGLRRDAGLRYFADDWQEQP